MLFRAVCMVMALACGSAMAEPPGAAYRAADRAEIAPADVVAGLRKADVVILGELHDNPHHHRVQAWLVEQVRPQAIVFEMLTVPQQEKAAAHLAAGGALGDLGEAVAWGESGWPDWALYRPIFEALTPDVTILGADPGRDPVMAAIRGSAAEAAGDTRFREFLARPLGEAVQAALEQLMIDAHCGHLPAPMAPGMVEGQRLRDASFASAVLRARAAAEGPVVLITGNGHTRADRGVPLYLEAVAPDLNVVTVGMLEREPGDQTVPEGQPYDFLWLTVPAEREDPCAALEGHTFGKQ